MAAGPFANFIVYLDQLGVTDVLLPFALIFAIIFAVLSKVKLFENKRINLIISIAISLLAIIPHVTGQYQQLDVIAVINQSLPQVALIFVAIVIVMILTGLVGGAEPNGSHIVPALAGLVGVLLLVMVFWRAIFPYGGPAWFSIFDDPTTQMVIVSLLFLGILVAAVSWGGGTNQDPWHKKASEIGKALFGQKGP